jgi:hypothetical protein
LGPILRRTLALIASSAVVLVGLTPGAGLSPAHAADPVTGRLVDSTSPGQNAGAPSMTVQLREVTAGGPGDVVAADVTSADGSTAATSAAPRACSASTG